MKRIILTILVLLPSLAFAQSDTTYWKKGGAVGLTFNQATLSNWAAGGVNSISGGAYFNQIFDYAKDDITWTNTIDLGYGFIQQDGDDLQKADDKIILNSRFGKKMGASDKWYFSALLDFRTQFAEGFAADNDSVYISRFMAPGYLLATIGIDYKPNEYFSMSIGPLTSKMTFVMDERLADLGSFGVEAAELDVNGNPIAGTGKQFRGEFGGTLSATFNKEIFKNVNYASNLLLFSNYLENPEKIDVNWENTITMKVNSVLSVMYSLQTIYDYDIKFTEIQDDGTEIVEERWQWKSILSIGLAYKFGDSRG